MDAAEILPTEDTEMEEETTRPKQNAEMLHATTPLPIKKEKGIKQEKDSSDSDSEASDSTADENFQKAITNENWGTDMQQQIDEALASNEMPAQMDSRFIKKSKRDDSNDDPPKKDFEKSKNEQDDDSPNKKEIDSGKMSLDEEEYDNLIKEVEDNKKQDGLTEEIRAQQAEEQRAQIEKLKKYTNKNPSKADKKKIKDKEKKEQAKAQKQLEKDKEKHSKKSEKPATPSKVTSRKDSADTPKTSRSGKTDSPK